jgi:predicted N-acetyltransferase YhbS
MTTLAAERPEHDQAVEQLLDREFGAARWSKTCQRLRDGRAPLRGASLVAIRNRRLIGSVRFWPVLIGRQPALMLGPLAVDCGSAGQGVGAALVRAGLAQAAKSGWRAAFLVGEADYYARFGFRADLTHAMRLPGPVERARFLALELAPDALRKSAGPVTPAEIETLH